MSYLHYSDTPISIFLFSCSQIFLLILNVYLELLSNRISRNIFLIISLISVSPLLLLYLLSMAHNYSLFKYLSQNYISTMFTLFSTSLMNPDSEVPAAEYMASSDWFKGQKVNQQ